ncbi:hypothetical protein B0H14DRAFT_3885950 [Mycena olivaceomarginata]|nr:hypothetical protein B0H14DRAFT_3885950 [Mycena olivaceomarginata]
MAALAARKAQGVSAYEFVFVDAINLALADIAKYGIKVVVNAGTSDTELLHGVVVDLVKSINLLSRSPDPQAFLNVHTGEPLSAWPFKPFYAQACLGGLGVAAALQHGADIVICGPFPTRHWWSAAAAMVAQLGLANALIAGHLIECSIYVTGGNFSGFKELEEGGRWLDLGYPIAEIGAQSKGEEARGRHNPCAAFNTNKRHGSLRPSSSQNESQRKRASLQRSVAFPRSPKCTPCADFSFHTFEKGMVIAKVGETGRLDGRCGEYKRCEKGGRVHIWLWAFYVQRRQFAERMIHLALRGRGLPACTVCKALLVRSPAPRVR